MASSGKRKTTMTKLAREGRLRERRAAKAARKDARKNAPADQLIEPGDALEIDDAEIGDPGAVPAMATAVDAALSDA
jgi:hypothetical protein